MAADTKSCACPESDVKRVFNKYGGSDGLDSEDLVAVLRCLDGNMPADKIKAFLGTIEKKGEIELSLDEVYDALFADLNTNAKPCTAQELAEEAEALVEEAAYEFRRAEREIYTLMTNLACKNAQGLDKGTTSSQENERVIITSNGEIVPLPREQAPVLAPPPPPLPHDLCTSSPPQPPEGELRPLYACPDESVMPWKTEMAEELEQQQRDLFRKTREVQGRIAQDLTTFLETQIEEVGRNEEHARRMEMVEKDRQDAVDAVGERIEVEEDTKTVSRPAWEEPKVIIEAATCEANEHQRNTSLEAADPHLLQHSCENVSQSTPNATIRDSSAQDNLIEISNCVDVSENASACETVAEMAERPRPQEECLETKIAEERATLTVMNVVGERVEVEEDDKTVSRPAWEEPKILIEAATCEADEHQRNTSLEAADPHLLQHSCANVSHSTANATIRDSSVQDNLIEVPNCVDVNENASACETVAEMAERPRPQEECPETKIAEDEVGMYWLVSAVIVKAGFERDTEKITGLFPPLCVRVLELKETEDRVRARIEEPPGWISLVDKATGVRSASFVNVDSRSQSVEIPKEAVDMASMHQSQALKNQLRETLVDASNNGNLEDTLKKRVEEKMATTNVPSYSAVSVAGTSRYVFCLGTYIESSIPPVAEHGRRAIFKGPNGKYLFYWCEVRRWMIGDDYTSCRAWLCSSTCECWTPAEVTEWREWDVSSSVYQPLGTLTVHEASLSTEDIRRLEDDEGHGKEHAVDELRGRSSVISRQIANIVVASQELQIDHHFEMPTRPDPVVLDATPEDVLGNEAPQMGGNTGIVMLEHEDIRAVPATLIEDDTKNIDNSKQSAAQMQITSADELAYSPEPRPYLEVACDEAVTVKGTLTYAMCAGTYARTRVPVCAKNGGRAVFRGPNSRFLYYWQAASKWLVGEDYQGHKANLCSDRDEGWCPSLASGWREWDASAGQFKSRDTVKVRKVTCKDAITITGIPSFPMCVGTYVRTEIPPCESNARRAIFKGPGAKYLFYWSETHKWLIGDDYAACKAWVCSAHADGWWPSQATEWREWNDSQKQFKKEDSIKAHKVTSDDVVVTVSGSLTYPLCVGTYVMTNIQPCENNDGRKVFKGPGAKYLFYWRDTRKWLIGDDYKARKAWLCSAYDDNWCPSQISAWREWSTLLNQFIIPQDSIKIRKVACEDVNIVVTGTPTYPSCLGNYVMSDIPPCSRNAGRAVFKGPGSKYLFYWRDARKWLIGDDYKMLKAWLCSATDESWCPSQVSAWREWDVDSKQFKPNDSISVQEVRRSHRQQENRGDEKMRESGGKSMEEFRPMDAMIACERGDNIMLGSRTPNLLSDER